MRRSEKKQSPGLLHRLRVALRRSVKLLRLFLVIFAAYLLQVCVIPFIHIGGVSPNMLIAVTSVITVCFGIWRSFWAGGMFGIMTEVMVPSRPLLNLALYPISAMLCAVIFSDKRPRQLEYERALGKAGRNKSPYLRTILCGAVNSLIFEGANIIYVYLRDGAWNAVHIRKGLLGVLLTTLLTLLVMFPLRRFFGFRRIPAAKKGQRIYQPAAEAEPHRNESR